MNTLTLYSYKLLTVKNLLRNTLYLSHL